MNLSEFTYGCTPAAMYLVRTLNEISNASLTRSCGKKITATNRAVVDLMSAYEEGSCSAKTVANCMRLMRAEITASIGEPGHSKESLVDQLCKNVQIGYIKRGMRLCQVARKGERVMENPSARSSKTEVVTSGDGEFGEPDMTETFYYFVDHTNGAEYLAGSSQTYAGDPWIADTATASIRMRQEDIQDMTPEILMDRSNRRCLRLGKAHTKVTND